MKNRVIWKKVRKDDKTFVNMPFAICEKCNREYNNGNVFASKYCPECSKEVQREKTRERVRRHREKLKRTGE